MGTILLALDTANPDMHALDFACYLSKFTHRELKVVAVKKDAPAAATVIRLWPSQKKNTPITVPVACAGGADPFFTTAPDRSIADACQNRGVNAVVQCSGELSYYDLIALTRFSGLLIIAASTLSGQEPPDSLSHFVKSLLRQAECPVIIPPTRFDSIDRIVFAYNGSKSSVFAIKQFSYLFPQFRNTPVTVLEINKHFELKTTERNYMRTWLQEHYHQVDFEIWEGNTPFALFRYFLEKENLMLVMGSFGRSVISQAFRPSAATKILKYINLPVFITHH